MGFFLFLLVNAALFLRPTEIIPQLEDAPIYEVLILACLGVSLPRVALQLTPGSLRSRPISACVVGLLGAVVISAVLNAQSGKEFGACSEFAKLLVYYLLLVAVVDTPSKLLWFVYYLGGLMFVLTSLALLQYHGVIHIPALASYAEKQWEDVEEGNGADAEVLLRLCAAGIYNNPNDLARILTIGILICVYGWGDRRSPLPRVGWLAVLGVLGYAFALTHSRGGLLGLLVAVMAYLGVRFGGRKSLRVALIVLPLLLILFGGRQTNFSTSGGTGQQRIGVWSDGFELWRENPLFGIGMNNYAARLGIAAHNSFVHTYTELGLIGGTCFLGGFYLGILLPYRTGKPGTGLPDGELRRFRPYLVGHIAGYMMGMMSSSRNYIPPTYMLIGLAAVYLRLAGAYLPATATSLNGRLFRHVALVSIASAAVLYLFVRLSHARV